MSRLVSLFFLMGLGVLAGACLAPDDAMGRDAEVVGRSQAFIVNGTIDNGHPAVGVVHSGGIAACTGTLFEPDKVLTAAHCVLSENPPYSYLQTVNFYLGGLNGTAYPAVGVAAHPSYSGGNKSDVAVIQLGKSISGVVPYPLAKTGDIPQVGESITMVGYGLTGENQGTFGTKRKAQNVISSVYNQYFSYDGAGGTSTTTCSGDSGGPTFAIRSGKETVIGVHSTSEVGCKDHGNDMRVDAMYSWITTQKVSKRTYGQLCTSGGDCLSGLCIPAGNGSNDAFCTQGCDSQACPRADDCVSVSGASGISKACVPNTGGHGELGSPCTADTECLSGLCVEIVGTGKMCLQKCHLTTQDCPTSYTCVSSSVGGLCVPSGSAAPPPKKNGETCVIHNQCASGICALQDTQRRCSAQCNPGTCPTGYDCNPVSGTSKSACIPKPKPKAKLGEACKGHADCESSLCAPTANGLVCIELCDKGVAGSCPSGYACVPIANNAKGACVKDNATPPPPPPPKPGELGSPCTSRDSCKSKLCANLEGKQWCTQTCDPAQGCPTGFDCVDAGGTSICAPSGMQTSPGDGGGCSIGRRETAFPSGALLVLGLFSFLALARRRGRRRL